MARLLILVLLGVSLTSAPASVATARLQRATANDNRTPGGSMEGDTLVLSLSISPAEWHILGEDEPPFTVLAFAEEGKAPTIPGPLLRVRGGTPVQVRIRNPLEDTLVVRGLCERGAAADSLVVAAGGTTTARFVARDPGNYLYWVTVHRASAETSNLQRAFVSQLAGAVVVDAVGAVTDDRVFVITELGDRAQSLAAASSRDRHGTPLRQSNAVNGKAWPHTERLQHAVGDTIRWRIINTSPESHPMHLHGFYFRVDSHGTPATEADSIYAPQQRRMVVTETLGPKRTMTVVWSPDRPGGWLFHCHLSSHAAKFPPIDRRDVSEWPTHHHGNPDQHALHGMNGLILGIIVTGASPDSDSVRPARRLRLFVQADSTPLSSERRFAYVLQRGAEPRPDSVEYPGPVLVLTRGEATSIEVINRSNEPTAVHWHGIELESYYDGVPGWSGLPTGNDSTAPAILPGKTFEVRITPKRAGTFMCHTHFNELRQQYGGLVGALIVLEPGETWDPSRDLVFLISDGVPQRVYINGSLTPPPVDLELGRTYRIRLADIAVFRMTLPVSLVRDTRPASWRPLAKDGFTLPPAQSTLRPSIANVPSGETADFEFTPDVAGDFMLIVGPLVNPEGTVRMRVSTPR